MNEIVRVINGEGMASSKEVADRFGKRHVEVLTAIKMMDCSKEFRECNFTLSSYISKQNKVLECYEMTRDGFSFLCMGFTGKNAAQWKEKYITAFNALEQHAKNTLGGQTLTDAINLATLRIEELSKAGSSWGKVGSDIKRDKKQATKELGELIACAQFNLNFSPVVEKLEGVA